MDLQSQNGTNVYGITANPFPTTYADLTFSERMENEQQGYEPYKDSVAYHSIKIADIKTTEATESYQYENTEEEEEEEEDTSSNATPETPGTPTTPTDPEKPENNEEELPEDYKPTHNIEDDKNGTYAILFRPQHEDLSLEEPFSENLRGAFWDKDCSDHAVSVIDDNAVLNRTLYKAIHNNKGKYDYFLTVNKIQGAYGILQSDGGAEQMRSVRKKTEQEAKHLALFLQKKWGLSAYLSALCLAMV